MLVGLRVSGLRFRVSVSGHHDQGPGKGRNTELHHSVPKSTSTQIQWPCPWQNEALGSISYIRFRLSLQKKWAI